MRYVTAILLLSFLAIETFAARQPNVLLIMADDLRDFGGAYTKPLVQTPNLDRLRRRGVAFERAYAQFPVCNPSRSSFLTGLRCEQTGIVGNHTFFRDKLPDVVTLPQLLRQNGWTTHSYGKIFHSANTGEAQRQDWLDIGKSWDKAQAVPPTAAQPRGEIKNLTGGRLPWCEVGILDGPDDEQPDGQIAGMAARAIRELHATGKPWMVAAGFHRPHDPFHATKKYFDLYPKEKVTPWQDPAETAPAAPMSIPGGWGPIFAKFTEDERREYLRAYMAGVSSTDAQVGRLLDVLDASNLWENTIVIFMGDHGFHLGERGWWNKTTLFERSCRAPLIIAAPSAQAGAVCRSPVEFLDLYPSVAELCGLEAPANLQGKSLRPLLKDPATAHKPAAFTLVTRGAKHFGQSVRTARWRFTQWSDGNAELYNHDADPEELTNLAGRAEHANTITDMKAHLATLPPWPPRP